MAQLARAGLPAVLGLTGKGAITRCGPTAWMTGAGRIPRMTRKQFGQDGRWRQCSADGYFLMRLLLLTGSHQDAHDIRIDIMSTTTTPRDLIRLWSRHIGTNICFCFCSSQKKFCKFELKWGKMSFTWYSGFVVGHRVDHFVIIGTEIGRWRHGRSIGGRIYGNGHLSRCWPAQNKHNRAKPEN